MNSVPESRATAQRPVEAVGLPAGARLGSGWRVERRLYVGSTQQLLAALLALAAALALSAILILIAPASVSQAFGAMLRGAFGGPRAVAETLAEATPLIFTGLAVTVAFRAGIWNIGAEGQFVAGAMGGVAVALYLGNALPSGLLLPLIFVTAALTGAALAAIPGYLKVQYGASEVIVTIMLNFIVTFFLSYMLSGPWRDPNTLYYQTVLLPDASHLPKLLARTRLHIGILIALASAAMVYLLLWKHKLGYEIRALGINPTASNYKGISPARVTITVMILSGAIAALGGACQTPGLHQRLQLDLSQSYGYTGIIIAMLGRRHPLGVGIAAVFFGAMMTGASAMQVATGVPVSIAQAIHAITLICLLVADVLVLYRVRRVRANG